ncbi:hypothetical protein B7Z00_01505 [Candidatus Saccharibacteria bacterium 32-50-10]|nr:MAG: hypothetical protein B7Z00_01505 [Candidatus Saccharibacteria bacterium 32-50-10]
MTADQFQIPQYEVAPEKAPFWRPESLNPTVELVREIRTVERDIENLRATADSSILDKGDGFRNVMSYLNRLIGVEPIDNRLSNRLIEAEANIGGQIFASRPDGVIEQRFWYFGDSDWFYEMKTPTAVQHIRYQLAEDGHLFKLIDGRPQHLNTDEFDNFIDATRVYRQKISDQLYRRAS